MATIYIIILGDIIWTCRQCAKDPTCVQCDQCFRQADHAYHEVMILINHIYLSYLSIICISHIYHIFLSYLSIICISHIYISYLSIISSDHTSFIITIIFIYHIDRLYLSIYHIHSSFVSFC
jgi:hypothetical protein